MVNSDAAYIPLSDKSVHMVVTSPPYYGLRSYSTDENKDKELGIEELHDCNGWATNKYCQQCYVCRTLKWTNEVWRVLRDDGIFCLNIADTYSGSGGSGGDYESTSFTVNIGDNIVIYTTADVPTGAACAGIAFYTDIMVDFDSTNVINITSIANTSYSFTATSSSHDIDITMSAS